MNDQQQCLNCNKKLHGSFCSNCGQKSDTHRLTPKHFFFHDILHGVWHLDKGLLFTLKEAIARPGQAALDYIGGKRIRYYNVFYLCLLLFGIIYMLSHLNDSIAGNEITSGNDFQELVRNNIKLLVFGLIPLFAFNGFICFRKLKLNIAEHFIIAGMILVLILLLTLLFYGVIILSNVNFLFRIMEIVAYVLLFSIIFVPAYVYHNTTKRDFSFWSFIFHMLLFYALLFMQLSILFIIFSFVFLMVTGLFGINLIKNYVFPISPNLLRIGQN